MDYLSILKALFQKIQELLSFKVPVWTALLLSVALAYYVTRPEPLPKTEIVYVDRWNPPIIRKPLPPVQLVQYLPVPKTELRTDTIQVPIRLTDYQLWSPSTVTRTRNSIVVRSFDVGTLTYRDYHYRAPQAKFDAGLSVGMASSVFEWKPTPELEGFVRYGRWTGEGRVGIYERNPYILGVIKYRLL